MNRPETIPPVTSSCQLHAGQMNALYLQVRLASVADASCKDRATPSEEHHLLPLAVPWSPGGLPAGGPTSSKGQRDEAASPPTHPAWLQEGQWLQSLSDIVGQSPAARAWPPRAPFFLYLPHLDGSEAAGILVYLVFGWLFISGRRVRGTNGLSAQPWGFSGIGHGFPPAFLGCPFWGQGGK